MSFALGVGAGLAAAAAAAALSVVPGARPYHAGAGADAIWALVIGLPIAYAAPGRAADALAWYGEIPLAAASRAVAVIGAVVLALLFLFVVQVPLLPAMLIAEAAVVVAWVCGALRSDHARAEILTVPRWIVLSVPIGIALCVTSASTGTGSAIDDQAEPPTRDLALAGRPLEAGTQRWFGIHLAQEAGRHVVIVSPPQEGGWSDLRLELWAALPRDAGWLEPDSLVGDLDPAVAGPLRIVPIAGDSDVIRLTIRTDDIRGLHECLVILTGMADGRRFALADEGLVTEYRATPMEWLGSLAPDSPNALHPVVP